MVWLICIVCMTEFRITQETHLWEAFPERREGRHTLNVGGSTQRLGPQTDWGVVEKASVLASFM